MPTLKSLDRAFANPSRAFLLISLLTLWLAEPGAVRAGHVADCTEEDLRIALSEGGTNTFLCSGTITVTNTIVISTNVVLDGTGQTTSISGGNAVRIFTVNPGVSFTVKNLTLSGGADSGANGTNGTSGASVSGGAIYNNGGTVSLVNCQASTNTAAGGNGGDGVVQLDGNGGSGGNGGTASGGAIFNNGGTLLLTNCVFSGNTANGGNGGRGADGRSGGNGGAGAGAGGGSIFNTRGGTVVIYDCTFSGNSVKGASGGLGGAANGLGTDGANGVPGISLSGGICNESGTVTILFSTFYGNSATGGQGGGALGGAFNRTGGTGTGGGNAIGGGIFNLSGALAMTNATFYANSAKGGNGGNGGDGGTQGLGGSGGNGGAGGSGTGGGVGNAAGGSTVTAVNCTFSKNSASGGAGGAGGASGGAAFNPGQTGPSGGSNGGGIANDGGPLTFTLKNSIVAYSSRPGDGGSGVITDGGNNISFDFYGAGIALTASTSFTNTNPYLGPLANNGGPTLTTAIIDTRSAAINAGNDAVCLATDQRHVARSGQCDIGAFELQSASLAIALQTNQVVLSWTTGFTGYSLEFTPSLSPASWTTVTNPAVVVGTNYVVTNNVNEASRFYRLSQ